MLSEPERLCKLAQARDAAGMAVPWNDPAACSWCLVWSAVKVVGDANAVTGAVYDRLRDVNGGLGPMDFADGKATHAEVLALIDRAIAAEAAK